MISGGIKFIIGASAFQVLQSAAEPYLKIQSAGPLPIGILIGLIGSLVTFLLLDNKKFPAGLVVVGAGFITGLILGAGSGISNGNIGFNIPEIFPFAFPGKADFTFALFALVLPQVPMTMGNAVLAYTDLSKEYFKEKFSKVTNRKACISMAFANFLSFCLGGMPLCHGAGGLAAHYRFGARTAGSNLMIGSIFLVLALGLGNEIVNVMNILPMPASSARKMLTRALIPHTIADVGKTIEFI